MIHFGEFNVRWN